MKEQRVEFIDLAKGMCILLVVMGHCKIANNVPGFEIVRMPFYFIISGLFFKTYGYFFSFFIKKTNRIAIPFFFFMVTSIILDYVFAIMSNDPSGMPNLYRILFGLEDLVNIPIWFLAALFWSGIFMYLVFMTIKNHTLRIITIVALGFLGYALGHYQIPSPFSMFTGLTALPYYGFGYYLAKGPILHPNRYDKYNGVFVVVLYGASYFLSQMIDPAKFDLRVNLFDSPLLFYVLGITSTLTLLLLCKIIKQIPILTYIGRYSIIVLCTHFLFAIFVSRLLLISSNLVLLIAVLALSIASIPLCKKIIPWFVAQKDLIKVE